MTMIQANRALAVLLKSGWKVEPCSCHCGGGYCWMKPTGHGGYTPAGCLCHTPMPFFEVRGVNQVYDNEEKPI